ncbi:MAG: hypothetical protein J7642_21380 [Cyanobacteria bacterium SBC]|nr:hypothetical protein [Cyanobacteria bacterium SBC]
MGWVRYPRFRILYGEEDVSERVQALYSELTYSDNLDALSDELTIRLSDPDRLWLGQWYPEQGEIFSLEFGYDDALSDPVKFEVDSCDSNLIDTFTLKATATPISKDLRTRNTRAWEETTLKEVFDFFAKQHGFELVGEIKEIEYERLTQENKPDLEFLSDEAAKHDHIIKFEGLDRMVVYTQEELDSQPPALTLTPELLLRSPAPRHRDKLSDVYRGCKVKCQNPDSDENLVYTIVATNIPSGDFFDVTEQGIETEQQAMERGRSALRKKNADKFTVTLPLEGSALYQAGKNFQLKGFGAAFDKVYQIKKMRHRFNSSGYISTVEARQILDLGEVEIESVEVEETEESDAGTDEP